MVFDARCPKKAALSMNRLQFKGNWNIFRGRLRQKLAGGSASQGGGDRVARRRIWAAYKGEPAKPSLRWNACFTTGGGGETGAASGRQFFPEARRAVQFILIQAGGGLFPGDAASSLFPANI